MDHAEFQLHLDFSENMGSYIIEQNAASYLVAMAKHPDPKVQEYSAQILYKIASDASNIDAIAAAAGCQKKNECSTSHHAFL